MDTRKLNIIHRPDRRSVIVERGQFSTIATLVQDNQQDGVELVRRWNAHPALVEALEGLLKATRRANSHAERADGYADEDAHFVGEWIDAARAALKAAK